MPHDDADRAAFAARLEAIRLTVGLPPFADPGAIAAAMNAAGVTTFFHGVLDDNYVADRLHTLHSRKPVLFNDSQNDGRPRLEPSFRTWLGGLASDYFNMPATKQLSLLEKWKAQTATAATSRADIVKRENGTKYGPDESKWPAIERSRMADLQGSAPATPSTIANTPSMGKLTPVKRLADVDAIRAANRLQHELQGLRVSRGGNWRVVQARADRIQTIEGKLAELSARHPTLVVA